jgi:hypothetical protein
MTVMLADFDQLVAGVFVAPAPETELTATADPQAQTASVFDSPALRHLRLGIGFL